MTKFEQRVAEALCVAHGNVLVYGDSMQDIQACARCQALAPRVAAAIGAAAQCDEIGSIDEFEENARQSALAALRGESA